MLLTCAGKHSLVLCTSVHRPRTYEPPSPSKKHEKMCYSCVCEMVLFIFLATHLIITPQFYSFIRCFQRYLLPWPTNESTTRPDIRTSSNSRTLLFICSRAVSCDFEWSSPATVARWRMRTENHANSQPASTALSSLLLFVPRSEAYRRCRRWWLGISSHRHRRHTDLTTPCEQRKVAKSSKAGGRDRARTFEPLDVAHTIVYDCFI